MKTSKQQRDNSNGRGRQTKVAVLGVGSFAQGLVSLGLRSGADARYAFCFGSRRVQRNTRHILPGLEHSPVMNVDDALADADIVILALPAGSLPAVISRYGAKLAHKVVVDVMNPWEKEIRGLKDTSNDLLPYDAESQKHRGSLMPHQAAGGATGSAADTTTEAAAGKDADCISSSTKDVDISIYGSESSGSNVMNKTPSSTAAWLASMLPASAHIVKAFCNLSAYSLLHGDPLTEHMKSVAASDVLEAAEVVAEMGRALGIEMRTVGSLSYAAVLEARQHSLLKTWQWPALLMFVTWLVTHIYSFIRYDLYGGTPWQHVTMWILNKSVGWVSLWGMVYTYLPGVLVCYMQLFSRKSSVRLPYWLKVWMDGRKQLGLLALAAMLLHLLLSTFLWMPSYYAKLWDNTDAVIMPLASNSTAVDIFGMAKSVRGTAAAVDAHLTHASIKNTSLANSTGILINNVITIRSKLNWIGESSTFLGIISGCLMGMIALTSMPSITPKLNWREWRLLQSQAGWLALITATVHVLLLGAAWWPRYKTEWPKMIPTITLLSTIPPMMLLLMKGLISLPPFSMLLARVRSGRLAKKLTNEAAVASTPVYAVADA